MNSRYLLSRRQPAIRIDLAPFVAALEDAAEADDNLADSASPSFMAAASELGQQLFLRLWKTRGKLLRDQRRTESGFQSRLANVWAPALDLFDLGRALATEFGEGVNDAYGAQARERQDPTFEALIRLHGRTCLTAGEVGALLKAGYATRAMARWRTANELATVAFFISQEGPEVARRYLDHQSIDMYRSAVQLRESGSRLRENVSDENLSRLRATYDQLLTRHGEEFKEDYGWAAAALGKRKPTFANIAQAVNLGHWLPYVRLASRGVHASSRGGFFDIGLHPDVESIPARASHFGLADAGGNTMISVHHATLVFLTYAMRSYATDVRDLAEGIMQALLLMGQVKLLEQLADLGEKAFLEIHQLGISVPPAMTEPVRLLQVEIDLGE